MGDNVFLKVMPKEGVVRFGKRGKLSSRYIRPFRDTQEGRYSCISVGFTAKFIGCPRGIPCLHALEIHSRSNSCSGLGRAYY